MICLKLPYYIPFAIEIILLTSCYSQTQTEHCFSIVNYSVQSGPETVKIADINQDSYPDIIVAGIQSNNLIVLLNDGDGKFNEADGSPFLSGNMPQDISASTLR